MMGVSQKLPTAISLALALTLKDNDIPPGEIGSHSTLTSLYGILAMCRVHAQNPRTYGEILSTRGAGRKIVRDFVRNLEAVLDLAEEADIEAEPHHQRKPRLSYRGISQGPDETGPGRGRNPGQGD